MGRKNGWDLEILMPPDLEVSHSRDEGYSLAEGYSLLISG